MPRRCTPPARRRAVERVQVQVQVRVRKLFRRVAATRPDSRCYPSESQDAVLQRRHRSQVATDGVHDMIEARVRHE